MIDLHCHSSFSDGEHSPALLSDMALNNQVKWLALTDHDTVEGLALLQQASCHKDLNIVKGIELSVRWKKHDIHIIGLNIDPMDSHLKEIIATQNERRIARAAQIADCLVNCGIKDALKKALELAGHQRIGRPHFGQLLINEGKAADMKAAFKRYLGRGKAAYVETDWILLDEAVLGIIKAKGQAVIAHPLKYSLTRTKLHELIVAFKSAGGVAMEVVSGETTVTDMNELAGLCGRFELLASTGSDYHGQNSRIALGKQRPLPVNCRPIWDTWDNQSRPAS